MNDQTQTPERESMEVDVVIVGAGPSGLATACRLMQLANDNNHELSVVVLEKSSEVGAHILSGAIFEPRALDELFPNWKELDAPLNTPVSGDEVHLFRSKNKSWKLPLWAVPKPMHNDGNYIISLGELCRWLGEQAEQLGVEIFPGFPASEILYHEDGSIKGVATGEMGRSSDNSMKATYEAGMELHAKVTIFAEGARGHLGKELIAKFDLDKDSSTQHYGIGIKELWKIDKDKHQAGLVVHGAGWPLSESNSTGGSFLYHLDDNLVSVGLITDLNYSNPYLSPFEEFQRFKHHPEIKKYLEGGERLTYGARAITKGGLNALPEMVLPNGLLIGCDAGTLNFSKIKGSHTAMKCGMLAAESAFAHIANDKPLDDFKAEFKQSWLYTELHQSRNFGAAIHKYGVLVGGAYNFINFNLLGGKLGGNLADNEADNKALKPADQCTPIEYEKADGVLSFNKTSSVYLSNTNHEEDQPVHLRLADTNVAIETNLKVFAGPEERFCPAGVYEFVKPDDSDEKELRINAQNCVHCKTCDIKDPTGNITWVTPEGGGGPNYPNM